MEDRGGCRDKKEEATDKETQVGTGMSLVFTIPVCPLFCFQVFF